MGRKGENIFHRKDGRWEARYVKEQDYFGRKIYGYVYGKSYQEVKNKRNILLLNLKTNLKKSEIKKNNKSFNQNIDEWLHTKELLLKKSTYTHYFNIIEKHLRPYFGKLNLYQINESIINQYIFEKINQDKLNISTVNQTLIILNSILKSLNHNLDIKLPKIKKKGVKVFKKNEIEKLENYIFSNVNGYSLGILISLHTGLRIGEICALKWKDIDLNNETITVRHTISRVKNQNSEKSKTKLIMDAAKTDCSIRVIPINKILKKYLEKSKKSYSNNYFIITNSNKITDPRTLYNNYKRILSYCHISNYTYHTLRHTFATKCCKLGLDPKSLSEILGHSNVKTTLSIYVHSDIETKKNFMNTIFINN